MNNDNNDTDNDDDTDDSDVNDSDVNNLGDTIIFGDDDSFIKNSVKRSFQCFFPFLRPNSFKQWVTSFPLNEFSVRDQIFL